ncbi:hypothetical protein [Neobacillus terrae]|nr:hypothetical protein [Neobacillus terrae]NHM33943.1 hypothetical protein [Neobacillus terrae]
MFEIPLDGDRHTYINQHQDTIEVVIFYYQNRIEVSAAILHNSSFKD